MTQQEQSAILAAIRQDNVSAFDAAVGKRKNLCFGRFSLLSICYLYRSRKIVRAFGDAMRQNTPTVMDEPPSLYADFAPLAGKALRLWAGCNRNEIHPLEMLAITGQWRRLRAEYARYALSQSQQERLLAALRLRYGVVATVQNNRLVLPPKPIPLQTRRGLRIWAVMAVLTTIIGAALTAIGVVFASGVPVRDAAQLAVLSNDKQYSLQCDVTLSSSVQWGNATLLGNGHTITVSVGEEPLLAQFDGTVQDATVVLQVTDTTIADDYALLCRQNNGVWQNVRFVVEGEGVVTLQPDDDAMGDIVSMGVLFAVNDGTVRQCEISGATRWVGSAERNGQLGVVAATNNGTVAQCSLSMQVDCQTIDLGGVVYQNNASGVIQNCTVTPQSTLSQTTDAYEWSPSVGGVACYNYGLIGNCEVGVAVQSLKRNVVLPQNILEIQLSYAYAAGVACHNWGIVEHCVMTGDIYAGGNYTAAYAGGVAATHEYDADAPKGDGVLRQNIVVGNVYGYGYYNYVGGVCGAANGFLTSNCVSGKIGYDSVNSPYLGCLLGLGNYDDATRISDNHCVQLQFNSLFGPYVVPVVGYWVQTQTSLSDAQLDGVSLHNLLDITEQEAYWYGK